MFVLFLVAGCFAQAFAAQWETVGPYGGNAYRVIVDPANPQHLYAATQNGQIYQSGDAGENWNPLPFELNFAVSLSSIVVNPKMSNELYVGVSENFIHTDSFGDISGYAGVYKSEDSGFHWTRLEPTKGWSVLSIAVHPSKPNIVLAGTGTGVFRSDDSGVTWQRISPAMHPQIKSIVSVAIDPSNPQIIFAGTTHLPWKTTDGGKTWLPIHEGIADDSDVFSISVNPSNVQTILLGACSGIYRSDTGGLRWTGMPDVPADSRRTHQLLQDPVNTNTYYASTANGLWKSVDGGRTWKRSNPYPYIVNYAAIDPTNPKTVYLATDRSGLLKSKDGGLTFTAINQGFVNRNIGRMISDDPIYVTSTYEGDFGGIFMTSDQGKTWNLNANQKSLLGKNVISLAVAPGNASVLIAGTYDGLLRSADGGKTWQSVGSIKGSNAPTGKINEVSFSGADANTVYAATNEGLYKSTDNGLSWGKNSSDELSAAILKFAVSPVDNRMMILSTMKGMMLSMDSGDTWNVLQIGDDTLIYDFAFSGPAQSRIFVASSRGLLVSADEGRNWEPVKGGPSPYRLDQIVISRNTPNEMYVLSRYNNSIYMSTNAGSAWTKLDGVGLEGTSVVFITISGRQPFAVTDKRGIFRLNGLNGVLQANRQDQP